MLGVLATPLSGMSLGRSLQRNWMRGRNPMLPLSRAERLLQEVDIAGMGGGALGLGLGYKAHSEGQPVVLPSLGIAAGGIAGGILSRTPTGSQVGKLLGRSRAGTLAYPLAGATMGGLMGYIGQRAMGGGKDISDSVLPASGAAIGYKFSPKNRLLGIALGGLGGILANRAWDSR